MEAYFIAFFVSNVLNQTNAANIINNRVNFENILTVN